MVISLLSDEGPSVRVETLLKKKKRLAGCFVKIALDSFSQRDVYQIKLLLLLLLLLLLYIIIIVFYCIVYIFKQDHRKSIDNLSVYSPVSVTVGVRDGKR